MNSMWKPWSVDIILPVSNQNPGEDGDESDIRGQEENMDYNSAKDIYILLYNKK